MPTGNLILPDSVSYMGRTYSVSYICEGAFRDCSGLTSITIPSTVTSIRNRVFSGCSGLTSVTIPNSVTSIGDYAFYNCSGLTGILSLPNMITSIGQYAFYGCSQLSGVLIIPNTVTNIGSNAFYSCAGLASISIPNSVTNIGSNAFHGVRHIEYHGIASGSPWGATNMNGITDGDFIYTDSTKTQLISYIGLGGSTFIPRAVTSLGNYAFSGCIGLTSVTIGDSVISIGNYAFRNCIGLTSVTIGSSVTNIGSYAFRNCSGLTSITCLGSVAPTLETTSFNGVQSTIPVNIPCGSAMSYYSRWNYFSNFVEAAGPSFNAISSDSTMGGVVILIHPTCQTPTAVVNAVSNTGYRFTNWSDGITDNLRSLVVTQDTLITAYYAQAILDTVFIHDTVYIHDTINNYFHDTVNNYIYDTIYLNRYIFDTIYIHDTIYVGGNAIDDVMTIDAKIYVHDGQIVVEGADGMPVMLYDATGRLLATRKSEEMHGGTPVQFNVPASGTYLIKVGNYPACKVVVIR